MSLVWVSSEDGLRQGDRYAHVEHLHGVRFGSNPPGSRTPATRQPFPQKQTIRAKKAIVEQNPGRTCSIELDDDQRDQRSVFVR